MVTGHTIRAPIEGVDFTLFYDYDQLQDEKLSRLTDDGKITWFRLRMDCVFLEPLRRVFDTNSIVYRELKSEEPPFRSFLIASFSILLNGVEALGSFLPPLKSTKRENRDNFVAFIKTYMRRWDINVAGTRYQTNYLPDILWRYFRNGIAHGFVIKGGGIDYDADATQYLVRPKGYLEIGPLAFFSDFLIAARTFLTDIQSTYRTSFLGGFRKVYPC